MITSLSVLGIAVLVGFLKKYIKPKFGNLGVQVSVFLVAFAIISVKGLATEYPPLKEMLVSAGLLLTQTIALYEIVLKPVITKLDLS